MMKRFLLHVPSGDFFPIRENLGTCEKKTCQYVYAKENIVKPGRLTEQLHK